MSEIQCRRNSPSEEAFHFLDIKKRMSAHLHPVSSEFFPIRLLSLSHMHLTQLQTLPQMQGAWRQTLSQAHTDRPLCLPEKPK